MRQCSNGAVLGVELLTDHAGRGDAEGLALCAVQRGEVEHRKSESGMSGPDKIDGRYEVYRVVLDYEALHEGLIDRVDDLQATRLSIDEVAGFAPGYSSKVLSTPPMKFLGRDSIGRDGLGKMLKTLGLALILVADDDRFAETKAQLLQTREDVTKRKRSMRPIVRIKRVKGFFTKENAAIMNKKQWENIPAAVRTKMMRKLAKTRWKAARSRSARLAREGSIPGSHQPPMSHASPVDAC